MDTGREFTKIARIAQLYAAQGLKNWGITPAEYECLRQIRKNPGISQNALAEKIGIDKAAVARQTAKLEEKGYLLRRRNPEDAREKLLEPTEQAQKIKETELSGEAAFYEWLFSRLPAPRRLLLQDLLKELYPCAKAERKSEFRHVKASSRETEN